MMKRNRKRTIELKDVFGGKKVSILGDSISTYDGISNDASANVTIANNVPFYVGTRYISSPDQTWWKDVINITGMQLLVNNSWEGTTVAKRENDANSSGCGDRAVNLHSNDGEEPDIIFVYIGTNDYAEDLEIGDYTETNQIFNSQTGEYVGDCTIFAQAYATMIHKIKNRYKNAEVVCLTLLQNDKDFNPDVLVKVNSYNDIIRKIADKMGVTLIDIEKDLALTEAQYRADFTGRRALHPNIGGMERIATSVLNNMANFYLFKPYKK